MLEITKVYDIKLQRYTHIIRVCGKNSVPICVMVIRLHIRNSKYFSSQKGVSEISLIFCITPLYLNFRAGSTFPATVCTVPSSMDRTSRCSKVNAVRLYASYRLNWLLLKGQRCVTCKNRELLTIEFLFFVPFLPVNSNFQYIIILKMSKTINIFFSL